MNQGFISLHRQLISSRVWKNEGLLKVWLWCLLKANHKDKWVSMKSGKSIIEVECKRGQFIFGRDSAAKELQMSPSTIRNRMTKLKNMQNVDIKADRQYSIITIINYDTYQETNKKEDSKEDNQRTGKGQPKDTTNNVNNDNNDNKTTIIEIPLSNGDNFQVTNDLIQELSKLYPYINIEQSLRDIAGWNIANKQKRKTPSGIRKTHRLLA